jgi:hypothetical protein
MRISLFIFSVSDQATLSPHTHGRGVSGSSRGRHHALQRNGESLSTRPSVNRTQQGPGRPFRRSDKNGKTRKGVNRFRHPNKKKQ